MIERPTILRPLVVAALALCACVCIGCGRQEAPPNSPFVPANVNEVPKTPLHYELADKFDAGVGAVHAIAIDADDRLYLAGSWGVRLMDAKRKELASCKTPEEAVAITLARDGFFYVGLTARIAVFDASGAPKGFIGQEGARPGQLRRITCLGLTDQGLFVADARNLCINRYTPGGDFINDIGKRNTDVNFTGIVAPSPYLGFVVDNESHVIVGNPGRGRIEVYDVNGKFLRTWGRPGNQRPEDFSGCCNPTNLALTRDGNIVTSEKGIVRVKVYDPAGRLLAYIPPKFFPEDAAGLALAVDSHNRIFVGVPSTGQILVFALTKPVE